MTLPMQVFSRRSDRLLAVLLCCLGLAASPTSPAANVVVGVAVPALEPDFLDQFAVDRAPTGTVATSLNVEGISNYPGFHATGSARAGFRSLGASAQVLTSNYFPDGFDSGTLIQSQAVFNDVAEKPGSGPGFIQFSVTLTGSAVNSHPDILRSGVIYILNVGASQVLALYSDSLGFFPTGNFDTALVPITFGVPFALSGYLETYVAGRNIDHDGAIVSSVNYANTATLGVVRIFDADRRLLPTAQLITASGTDYLAPVPLPGCAPMLAALVLAVARRHLRG